MVGHGERAGRRWRIAFASVVLSFAGPTIAEPCGAIFVKHEPDAAERQIDRQPPAQVAATAARILRGTRSDGSCGGIGFLEIEITGAKDDRTPREELGYRFALVAA